MNFPNRQRMLISLLLVLLGAATIWSYATMAASQETAIQAVANTTLCQDLASRIQRLKAKPSLAGSQEMAMTELAKRIEQAASSSQIPSDHLVRITPEDGRRISDSAYKEKPTQVLLKNVTLRQSLQFLHTLSAQESGLSARHVRLSAPREQENGDRWNLDATLSYLLYSPASNTPSGPETP